MAEVIRGTSIALLVRVLGAGLGFSVNVILARFLGTEGAGLYFLSLTVITVGVTIGCFGLDNTILRFVAAYASREAWGSIKQVYQRGVFISALASLLITIVLAVTAPWVAISLFNKPELTRPIQWMSLSVLPLTMLILHGEAIKALKRVRDSLLINGVLLPLFVICGLLLLIPSFGVTGAVWSHTAGAACAALLGRWIWQSNIVHECHDHRDDVTFSKLLQFSFPLFLISLMGIITNWSATLLLGIWGTKAEVGIYAAASRTAMLTSFILISVNSIAAPKFAALYESKDMHGLELVACQSAKIMTVLSSPFLILFIVAPEWVMGIYGLEFKSGGLVLTILAMGQFVNVATGSVGYILIMTGYEKLMRNNMIIVCILSLFLGWIIIPKWGGSGAALSTSVSLSILNLMNSYMVWQKLGINTISINTHKYIKSMKE